jgi:hypothetical protein
LKFLQSAWTKTDLNYSLAIGLSFVLMDYATSPAAKEAKTDLQLERTSAALIRRTDADSLAAAGLLSLSRNRDNSLALMARAPAASQSAQI